MRIPAVLTEPGSAGSTPAGAAWLETIPGLIRRAVKRWKLQLEEPFEAGTASWAAPGTLPDGTSVVLKISFPHDEARHEAVALATWQGHAAVELLDHDGEDWALLLRRVQPGTTMFAATTPPSEQIEACLSLLADLHRTPSRDVDVPELPQVCAKWAQLATRRADTWASLLRPHVALVRRGIDQLAAFAAETDAPRVLLHGDLNPGNVLLENPGAPQWLAIDPKPMIGDPAYELWPVLSQIDDPFEHSDPLVVLRPRLQRGAQVLRTTPRRAALWAFARTVESILWQLDTSPTTEQQAAAIDWLAEARGWATLADAMVEPVQAN